MLNFFLRSIVLGLATAALVLLAIPSLRTNVHFIPESATSDKSTIDGLQISFSNAVSRAAPAVVNIYSSQLAADNHPRLQGLGSGVIVSEKGYIITNYHVVALADQILVDLQDGRRANAQMVGKDRLTDLAILKIELNNLPVIPLNPQYQAQIGDIVLAIGNPYNLGQTTTFGIISATGRSSISASGRQDFIQTDAAINKGNSGGALVNSLGELVGINTASFQQATDLETYGISFAIPYPLVDKIMQKIIADGRVIRGYIGIDGHDVTPVISRMLGGDYAGSIIVLGVDPNGPAARAGFQKNDVILSIGEQKINGRQSVMDIVAELRPGTAVNVGVLRDGEQIQLPVIVGEMQDE